MTIDHAIILGLIQGLTEFIPVSSSGHLALIPKLFGWEEQSTAFDAMLHGGTLLALLISFRRRIYTLTAKSIEKGELPSLIFKLAVATIPAGLVAFFFQDQIDELNSSWIIATMLITIGIAFILSDLLFHKKGENTDPLSIKNEKYFIIGSSQILALIRGSSRSGVTILVGRGLNLSLKSATELSFLLGIPITLLAFAYSTYEIVANGPSSNDLSTMAAGLITSFISGMVAISFMMRFVERVGLKWFGVYRIILGIIIILIL